jgi:non-canonical (house-cleaning) NTP pyrophosphatase
MKIALGTKSQHKIMYLGMVCKDLGFDCELATFNVASGVSEQPVTSAETKRGSINRAKAALELAEDANVGLGIEAGYEKIDGKYNILCWAIAISDGGVISCCSTPFPMPDFHHEVVEKGLNLGDHARTFRDLSDDPVHLRLAEDLIHREPYLMDVMRQIIKKLS